MESMFLIAWLNARPYCWVASCDGGKTWTKLKSDNEENRDEAIEEAAKTFDMAPYKWTIKDEPISRLM